MARLGRYWLRSDHTAQISTVPAQTRAVGSLVVPVPEARSKICIPEHGATTRTKWSFHLLHMENMDAQYCTGAAATACKYVPP